MGNGQHRNRRGARPRPAPHKHGGASSPGRATTQLIPPTLPANAEFDASDQSTPLDQATDEELASDASSSTQEAVAAAEARHVLSVPVISEQEGAEVMGAMAPVESGAPEPFADAPAPAAGSGLTARDDSAPGRGRFYAPGQGARPERPDHAGHDGRKERTERAERPAPQSATQLGAVPTPFAHHVERPERAARVERVERAHPVREPVDADDEQEYTGPRGDVRGSVGDLIDSLHEVFVRDRAMASQGGVTRCGVCYLHFPASELIYREADGFYVCESCAHALGAVRVPMVRRQQRQ